MFQLDVSMTHKKTVSVVEMSGLKTDRPMETGLVWAPPITEIGDGYLKYDPGTRKKQKPSPALLTSFVDLAEADDRAIGKFASRWGALGIDNDGWPVNRTPGEESMNAWRVLARRFRGAINLGCAFNLDRPGTEQAWTESFDGEDRFRLFKPWEEKSPYRTDLQMLLRSMIQRFRVMPRFWWNVERNHWQIDLDAYGPSNLPGILVIQAMLLIADKDGLAVCSSCHRSYIPDRRPDPTRRNYCSRDDCRKRAAWKDAARERRRRLREKKESDVKTRKR
jgi:hypothetical protein